MQIEVDKDVCVAAGQCFMALPSVFDIDDEDGTVTLLDSAPDDALADDVRNAANSCPSGAITVLA